jgi:NADH:ubiquinone oxidoreductase subunit C
MLKKQLYIFKIFYIFKNIYFGNRFKNMYIVAFDLLARCTRSNILYGLLLLRYEWLHQFIICIDIVSFDKPGKKYPFTIIYHLLSLIYNIRFQLLTQTTALKGLNTISILYKNANWSERELWDIFGIFILFHTDLRRLLTDYGFEGYPLRKDFPLTGYKEVLYSDFNKNVIYRSTELIQNYRIYKFSNPWLK